MCEEFLCGLSFVQEMFHVKQAKDSSLFWRIREGKREGVWKRKLVCVFGNVIWERKEKNEGGTIRIVMEAKDWWVRLFFEEEKKRKKKLSSNTCNFFLFLCWGREKSLFCKIEKTVKWNVNRWMYDEWMFHFIHSTFILFVKVIFPSKHNRDQEVKIWLEDWQSRAVFAY